VLSGRVRVKILITNDDGIHARGLVALRAALAPLGEVLVIAPERPRSACGHAITLHKPLRLTRARMADGTEGYASNGTPADCVALGVTEDLDGPPDLVVAGINRGPNLGVDMSYSGTVAAAMEAAICGLPSFSISIASYRASDYSAAAEFARYLAERLLARKLSRGTFLNVNVPAIARNEIEGVSVTRQARIGYSNRIEKRSDPRGETYYWLSGERVDLHGPPGADWDVRAIADKRISITPVRLDLTDDTVLSQLREWDLRWPG
jgi:5'-nucleotidase